MKTMLKTIAAVAAVATLPAVVANAARLEHRWSFNGDINDSVGTATATTIGTSTTVNYIDNAAVRTGADQAGTYATALCLGSSLISGNSATLEIWATRNHHTEDMRVFDWGSGTREYLCIGWNDSPQMWFRKNNKGINGATIDNCFANDVKYHIVVTVTKDEDNSVKVDFVCRNAADPSADVKRDTSTVSDWGDVAKVLSANLYLGHSQWPGESGNDANATYDEVRLWSGVVPDELLALSAVMGPDVLALSYDNEGKANISIAADGILPISVSTVGNGYTLDGSVSLGAGAAIQFDAAGIPDGMTFTAEGGFNVPSGAVEDYVTWTGSGKYNVTLNGNTISLSPAATIADVKTAPRLRIGILSDIHLKDTVAVQKLERALRVFRKGRVDGVLICGDLADSGIVSQLEELAGTWEKVFPGSKGIDGGYVERLFHYGDHDNRGYLRKNDSATKELYSLSDAEYGENLIFKHPKDVWERVFGEPWTPIMHKRVKGYDFILAHFNPAGRNTTPGLKPFLEGLKLDASRPFFYSQHRVLRNTVCGSGVWGQDDGSVGCILSAYPNCCAFCGHSHQTAVREDAIWQGAFTAIQVPSLRYVTHEDGHQNKPNGGLAEQGMLLLVYDDSMVVQRIDFANRRPLAEAWRIPLAGAERPFAHATRRRTAAVPQFEKDARLGAWVEERLNSLS